MIKIQKKPNLWKRMEYRGMQGHSPSNITSDPFRWSRNRCEQWVKRKVQTFSSIPTHSTSGKCHLLNQEVCWDARLRYRVLMIQSNIESFPNHRGHNSQRDYHKTVDKWPQSSSWPSRVANLHLDCHMWQDFAAWYCAALWIQTLHRVERCGTDRLLAVYPRAKAERWHKYYQQLAPGFPSTLQTFV